MMGYKQLTKATKTDCKDWERVRPFVVSYISRGYKLSRFLNCLP